MNSTPNFMHSHIELTSYDYMEVYNKSSDLFMAITSNEKSLKWGDITINHDQNAIYYNDRLIASEHGFESDGCWYDWSCKFVCDSSECWIEEEEIDETNYVTYYVGNETVKEITEGQSK